MRNYAIGAWCILVIVVAISFVRVEKTQNKLHGLVNENRHLISENQHRIVENQHLIKEIQKSRVTSCIGVYTSIQQVFRPFYPPKKARTPAQRKAVKKFEDIINKKKAKCRTQTKLHRRADNG